MLQTVTAERGLVVAPHHLAAQAGLQVLREGGDAVEAMLAAAATISVVYPHMNGLGGDGFWLIDEPGRAAPHCIVAVGAAAAAADEGFYREMGLDAVPTRGPLAANTVAGTVSGWQAAFEISRGWGGRLPLERLLADAIHYAEAGYPVTESQSDNTAAKQAELAEVPGWSAHFLDAGQPPTAGNRFRQPALAATLRRLASAGLDDFYHGELARALAAELERHGSPVRLEDLERQQARVCEPL
ncbi:MAG: gamma-glutamyltransferase, partial [Cytophagales bacterium]|nr:gamma-glutamyltransferase [Cytophagales bacterium]